MEDEIVKNIAKGVRGWIDDLPDGEEEEEGVRRLDSFLAAHGLSESMLEAILIALHGKDAEDKKEEEEIDQVAAGIFIGVLISEFLPQCGNCERRPSMVGDYLCDRCRHGA